MWPNTALVFLVVVLLSHPAVAQVRDSAPTPPLKPPTHRFFDTANITLTLAESAALLADGYYTQKVRTDFGGFERDPIARPFVERGWPGQIAGGALVIGAEVGLRYLLHRSNHHKLERLIPLGLVVYGTVGAVHNAGLLHDLQAESRGW